jgi:hypothetical protein
MILIGRPDDVDGEELARQVMGDEGTDDERVRPGVEGYTSVSPSLVYSAS